MSVYNYKVTDYAHGQKITNYARPIVSGIKRKRIRIDDAERTPGMVAHSLNTSINRTKNIIYDLSKSNDWDWFITLTFDPKRFNSSDYDVVVSLLKKFIDKIRKRCSPDLVYMIVPELHKDQKKFHFHGLFAKVGSLDFTPSGKDEIFNIPDWRYGFSTASKIKDSVRASAYITKYITKECVQVTKYKRRYYTSRNIKRPVVECYNSPHQLEDIIATYNPDYIASSGMGGAHNQVTYMEIDD